MPLFLHLIAVFLLMCAIFQPELSLHIKTAIKKPIVVMIDNSLSMSTKDKSGISKIDRVREFLAKTRYLKKYRPIFYSFGSELKTLAQKDIPFLKADQHATKIASLLSDIIKTHSNNCSGVVILSDGYETQYILWEEMKNKLTVPVYTIGIGEESAKDIGIATVITNSPIYEGEVLKISSIITQKGYDNENVVVSLKENKKLIQGKTINLASNFNRVDFEIPSLSQGDYVYEISVQPGIGESNLENNHCFLLARVISPTIHILYVEGNLRWEYKFLKRFLESDRKIETCSLVRIGESTFQQIGGKTIDIPPDILGSEKFLQNFNIIIFGDIDFSSFSEKDLENLRNFVEKNGSILFLGGENFLKGLNRTPIKEILPVNITGNEASFIQGPFRPSITEEGKNLTVFEDFQSLPVLDRLNVLNSVKPGGIVLIDNPVSNNAPIVVTTTAFTGRCAVVATDSTWKWYYGSNEQEKTAYEKFWGRIIRFLCKPEDYLKIGDIVPEIFVDRIYAKGEKVDIKFVFKNQNKHFKAYITGPDNLPADLNISQDTCSFVPDREGIYIICAENEGKINKKEFVVTKHGSETENIGKDDIYLKKLAEISDGEYFPVENPEGLVNALKLRRTTINTRLAVTDTSEKYVVFIIFLVLSVCWFLRRRHNIL
ncbi:MAG TPA: hypothetical protein PK303_06580 [bacterium]|nr:hypothetical protein [bacterium]HPP08766.1 hypothetical protein [bacterium]